MGLFDFFKKGEERKKQAPAQSPTKNAKEEAREQEQAASSGLSSPEKRKEFRPKDRPPASSHEYYEVQKGDSLSKIAKERYGDAGKWKMIYEANKDSIKNPDMIYPGQVIELPDLRDRENS